MVHNNHGRELRAGTMAKRSGGAPTLPKSLKVEQRGAVAILTLARPEKRNALNDTTVLGLETFFETLPRSTKAVVLNAQGEHFSAGLDLSELKAMSIEEGIAHSR